MLRLTSQISKSVDLTKSQKSKYIENKTYFFLQIRKFISYTLRATLLERRVL